MSSAAQTEPVFRHRTPLAFQGLYLPCRYKIYWGGRGGAKSTAIADALLSEGDDRPLRILCAREIQKSLKESVYQLLVDRIKEGEYTGYNVTKAEITHPNGTRIFFEGLWQNVANIKSVEGIDIVWVEESNVVSEDSWKTLIPTIRKQGSEIWASFNPELKTDPVYQRFVINPPPDAQVVKTSYRDNPWVTQVMLDEIAHLKATDYDEYLHVYEGQLRKFGDGAIFGKQMLRAYAEERVCNLPIMPGVPVNTFWDLGKNDQTAIWFHQRIGIQDRFIDYEEARLQDLDYYARLLQKKDYLYGEHYLPHDAEHDRIGMTASIADQLESMGVKPQVIVPQINHINEGIEMTRQVFAGCWFDADRCEEGIAALSNYKYKYDKLNKTHYPRPLHNWASNGADAFRQFAQGYDPDEYVQEIGISERRKRANPEYTDTADWMV